MAGITRDAGYTDYNSGGTNKYIPLLFAKKVLRRYYATSAYELVANTDYEGEIKKKGDSVIIRRAPAITMSDYTVGEHFTYEVPDEANTSLDINFAKKYAFRIDDVDSVASDLNLMNMLVENARKELEVTVDTAVLGEWASDPALLAANMGATAGAISGDINMGATGATRSISGGSSGNAVDFLYDAELVLLEQDVNEEKWAIMPTWYITSLKSGDIRRADITGDGNGSIRTGLLGTVNGMTTIASNNLPTNTVPTPNEYTCFVGTKEAVTFAMQMTKSETIRIPDSFGDYTRGLVVFGTKIVQPKAVAVGVISRA